MTELVSRAMYDAMVAERDALAAEVKQLAAFVDQHQELNGPLIAKAVELAAERDALAARVTEWVERYNADCAYLEARVVAAHGLQSRAERAEAALVELAKAAREGLALANACEASDGDPEYTAMIEIVRHKLRAALAAVRS